MTKLKKAVGGYTEQSRWRHSSCSELSLDGLKAAKQYIIENLDKGFIVLSASPYACPFLMAKKPSGGLRFCVYFRKLNTITKKDCYPLPLLDEVLQRTS
ncbi:Pc06g00940, partial [Penicillium rubens Wisconsin 54-1255]